MSNAPSSRIVLIPSLVFGLHLIAMAAVGALLSVGLRLFTLTAGWTAPVATAVAIAIAAGGTIGAVLASRWLDRRPAPLALLTLVQAGFGLAVLAASALFPAVRSLYLILWPLFGERGPGCWTLRFGVALALFALPAAFAIGMAPPLQRLISVTRHGFGVGLGLVFSLSLFGLGLGFAFGRALILPEAGLRGGMLIGVALAGIAAAGTAITRRALHDAPGALGAMLGQGPAAGTTPWPGGEAPVGDVTEGGALSAAVVLFGFSAWTYLLVSGRSIALVVGATDPATGMATAAFLAGLALGALLIVGLPDRTARPCLTATILVTASCLAAYASMFLLPHASLFYLRLAPLLSRPALAPLAAALTTAMVVLPASLLMGAALPVLPLAVGVKRRPMIGTVGLLALGIALADGTVRLLIIPSFGLRRAASLGAAVGLLSAILFLGRAIFARPAMRPTLTLVLLGLMVLLGGFPASWDPRVVASGAYRYGLGSVDRYGSAAQFLDARRGLDVIFYREGRDASVMIERGLRDITPTEKAEVLDLRVDGKVVASNAADLRTQVLLAHVPLLVRGPAENVLLIDYLSGVTAGSILRHPVKSLKIMEWEPVMFVAAIDFAAYNNAPLGDPRVVRVTDSARARLLVDQDLYDVVIVSEFEPWLAHSAALATTEGYALLKSRLRPGGLLAQRLPLAAADDEGLRTVLRTFAGVFPSVLVFQISPEDLLLVGSGEPLALDVGWFRNVTSTNAGVGTDLRRAVAVGPNEIIMAFRLDGAAARGLAGEGPLNGDDRSPVEAAAVRSVMAHREVDFLKAVERAAVSVVPVLKNYGALPQERSVFLYNLAKSYLGIAGDYIGAREVALELSGIGETAMARWIEGECLFQQKRVDAALEEWKGVLAIDPSDLDALFSLGTYYVDIRDYFQAEKYLSRAARLHPGVADVRYHYGRDLFYLGRYAEAIAELRKAREIAGGRGGYPVVDYLVGVAQQKLHRDKEAKDSLEAYLKWAYGQKILTLVEVDAHLKLADALEGVGKRYVALQERQKGEELRRRIDAYMQQQRSSSAAPAPSPDAAAPPAPPSPAPPRPDGP